MYWNLSKRRTIRGWADKQSARAISIQRWFSYSRHILQFAVELWMERIHLVYINDNCTNLTRIWNLIGPNESANSLAFLEFFDQIWPDYIVFILLSFFFIISLGANWPRIDVLIRCLDKTYCNFRSKTYED